MSPHIDRNGKVCNRILVMALCAAVSQAALADLNGQVVGVPDGDTLTLRVDGGNLRVRLDGIDAPELGQPYGKSARRSLAQICRGKPPPRSSAARTTRVASSQAFAAARWMPTRSRCAAAWPGCISGTCPSARRSRSGNERAAAEGGIVARQGARSSLGLARPADEKRQVLGKAGSCGARALGLERLRGARVPAPRRKPDRNREARQRGARLGV